MNKSLIEMGLKFFLCVASSIFFWSGQCSCHSAKTKVLKDKLLTKWEKVGENGTKWLKNTIFTVKPVKIL